MASKKSVELFYDVVSPYTWFAFEVMCRYRSVWNIDLKLRPFFLGGVMHTSGNKPPGLVPSKSIYLTKDVNRLAKYFEVPLVVPADPAELMFVKGSLKAQRFLTALDMKQPDKVEDMSRELWMRAWHRDEDISEEKGLSEAAKNIGLSKQMVESLLASIKEDAVKERLKKTTQEALDFGAFGSPIIATDVDGKREWVFGSDRFPIVAQILGEKWEGPKPGVSSKL